MNLALAGGRRLPAALPPAALLALVVAPACAALVGGWDGAAIAMLAPVVAVGVLLDVHLPSGGRLPLGHALVIALTELLPRGWFGFVVGVALVSAWPVQTMRLGARRAAASTGWLAVAAAAAIGGHALGAMATDGSAADDELAILARVALAGVAYLLVDLVARGPLTPPGEERVRLRQAWPMEVALLCVAGLLAVLHTTRGAAAAALALVPLLATRFSFERYWVARRTYAQTTQALGIVPEVAGLVPLGHAERTAVYAAALAEQVGLDAEARTRTVTAARLHHIGHISRHDPATGADAPASAELGRIGAEILEQTGFLADVAKLVEEVGAVEAAFASVPVAIVRVASTFDELVGDDPKRVRAAVVELLARHGAGNERSMAIALLRLTDLRPEIVTQAVRQAAPLVAVSRRADGEDAHDHEHGPHDDC